MLYIAVRWEKMGLARKIVINVVIIAGLFYAFTFLRTSNEEKQYSGVCAV